MADQTNGLGFRKISATQIAALYYFATLHGAGGSALDASTTDAWTGAGMAGELSTGFGYTQGGVALGQGSVVSNTNVDAPDAVWTASGGSIGPASYVAFWCNTTNTMTGAKFVASKDASASPQTATDGQTMTWTMANPIQY